MEIVNNFTKTIYAQQMPWLDVGNPP